MDAVRKYRTVPAGTHVADAITVGIETGSGAIRAVVSWPPTGTVEASKADYDTVEAALAAAEAAQARYGFAETVVALAERSLWQAAWGELVAAEPIGDLRGTDVSSEEAYEMAASIEAERDA